MKILKYLYKKMYDDVKDGEMLYEYAKKLKGKPGYEDMAKYFASEAMSRVGKGYTDAKTFFTTYMTKEGASLEESKWGCIMEDVLEELDDWAESVHHRLKEL